MQTITLNLPFPPSVNHYWRHTAIGKRVQVYISTEGKTFREQVRAVVMRRRLDLKLKGIFGVFVELAPPNNARRDVDNYGGKALLDAITYAGVWQDDSQVHSLRMDWAPTDKEGYAKVTIFPLEDLKCRQVNLLGKASNLNAYGELPAT